ncbi:MAG: hypothetical protein QME59_05485 [Candidatus Hydrothermarchaeota archaeon]|nr:hypothetical protein [Candidatus Hydrothermarchaeota archaeon]
MFKCPGSEAVKRPEIILLTCPKCGEEVEIFSDEQAAKCSCGNVVCKYAKECVRGER